MSQDSSPFDATDHEEPLYTDEHGVPMLFDVVVPGDYVKAAGVLLGQERQARSRALPPVDAEAIKERLERAIEAVMPAVTAQATRMIREALQAELHPQDDPSSAEQ